MRIVIADASPINYLIQIGHADILRDLFGQVILPSSVQLELTARKTPAVVQEWMANSPAWLKIYDSQAGHIDNISEELGLDAGEAEVVVLAEFLKADLVLMDERKGVAVARRKGLKVTGTLGILDLAAHDGLLNFSAAIDLLRCTNCRFPENLVDSLLEKHA